MKKESLELRNNIQKNYLDNFSLTKLSKNYQKLEKKIKLDENIKALIDKGFVKLGNFLSNPRKDQYAYLLTPKGIREKSLLTYRFLELKRQEFRDLQNEIKTLEEEAGLSPKRK